MNDAVEKLLNSAVEALQSGNPAVCISLTSQALQDLAPGDRRIPEALSLRGTARLPMDASLAMQDLQQAVQLDPQEPQFLTALGQAFSSLGMLNEAEAALRQAWQFSKGHPVVTSGLARILLQNGKAFEAVQLLGPLVEKGNANSGHIRQFAEALFRSGDIYGARDVLGQFFGPEGPQTTEDRLQLARIDLALRDYGSAEKGLKALLKSDPDSVPALMSAVRLTDWKNDEAGLKGFTERLANLCGDRADALSLVIEHGRDLNDSLLQRAEKLLAEPSRMAEEQASLGFSLALYFDRKGDFERAFKIAQQTNERLALHRGAVQSAEKRAEIKAEMLAQLKRASELTKAVQGVVDTGALSEFIYLVGAPRTGSSLIQSILAAGPGIESVGERTSLYPYLTDVVRRDVSVPAIERLIVDLAKADRAGLERERKTANVIVDKTPHHIFVAGLLQKVNPRSKFVHVFRDAGDVALSMFLRPFSEYFAEATSLDAVADMLEVRLTAHQVWIEAGLPITAFSYDRFVSAPQEQGERLFSVLGLAWKETYLDPKVRPEAVQTFSSRQVRQAITAKKAPHWASYESFAPDAFARLAEVSTAQNAIIDTKV